MCRIISINGKASDAYSGRAELRDRLARGIAVFIVRWQERIAATLSSWEQRCNLRQKKILLFLFFLSGCAYCSYVLGDALLRQHPPSRERLFPPPMETPAIVSFPPPDPLPKPFADTIGRRDP